MSHDLKKHMYCHVYNGGYYGDLTVIDNRPYITLGFVLMGNEGPASKIFIPTKEYADALITLLEEAKKYIDEDTSFQVDLPDITGPK